MGDPAIPRGNRKMHEANRFARDRAAGSRNSRDRHGEIDAGPLQRADRHLHRGFLHALMFLDRTQEAQALYLKYRDEKDVQDNKSWTAVILEDFVELRKAGLSRPLMDEIEKKLTR